MRYAIYFTPPQDHPLTRAAARWLGRDAFDGAIAPPEAAGDLSPEEIAFHTASARRYGFHATLKAPFVLAETETETRLDAALAAYAAAARPFTIGRLVLAQLDGFFALVPAEASPELQDFAGDVVHTFDGFRAPLTDADMARRNPDALSPAEFTNLTRWGYPYVFDQFRFHMTLTGRASGNDARRLRAALDERFDPLIAAPFAIDGLALFIEPEPGAPFVVRSYHAFRGPSDR